MSCVSASQSSAYDRCSVGNFAKKGREGRAGCAYISNSSPESLSHSFSKGGLDGEMFLPISFTSEHAGDLF